MADLRPLARIADITEDQWGLITRRQAEDEGIPKATFQRLASAGMLRRIAHGVYQIAGTPIPDHLELRAAWLQLVPGVPSWERGADEGVVSHGSAAALYGIGQLPADRHEFTVPSRRQTRRADVRLHVRALDDDWIMLRGLPVTRPSRIAADLLADHEDPEAVANLIADAIRPVYEYPGTFALALSPLAARFGFRARDGIGVLRWLLGLVGDPKAEAWVDIAREGVGTHGENRYVPINPQLVTR